MGEKRSDDASATQASTEPSERQIYGNSEIAPQAVKSQDLTYNDYLEVEALLSLQKPQSDPAHHDEMLFIIIHQAYELWFKLLLHEMQRAMDFMADGHPLRARHFLNRSVEIMRLLVSQIHIVETMRPVDFLHFRHHLMPASGFQSVQFREIEFMAGLKDARYTTFFRNRPDLKSQLEARLEKDDLRTAWSRMMRKAGLALPPESEDPHKRDIPEFFDQTVAAMVPVYENPESSLPLYMLCESLISFDEYLSLWREHHVRVVSRVIGWRQGTGGSAGVDYLRSTASKQAFPELWAVRTGLTRSDQPLSQGCPMGYGQVSTEPQD